MEVRAQLLEGGSLLSPYEFWGSYSLMSMGLAVHPYLLSHLVDPVLVLLRSSLQIAPDWAGMHDSPASASNVMKWTKMRSNVRGGDVSEGVTTGSEMTLEEVRSNCGSLVPGGYCQHI